MKISTYFLLIILLLGITFSYFGFNNTDSIEKLLDYYGITNEQLKLIEERSMGAINYSTEVNESIKNILVYNYEEKQYTLQDLLIDSEKGKKLVIKFSSLECSYCIEHIIKYVEKYENEIGVDNILFLGYFPRKIDFLMFNRLKKLKYDVYNIHYDSLGLPIDYLTEPYIVILDSTLTPHKIFVPNKLTPERTNQYFKEISRHILN